MNTKRLLFALLVLLGLLGIAATVYFLFVKPNQRPSVPAPPTQQQEPLPVGGTVPPPAAATPRPPAPAPDSPEEQERKAREALFRRSRDLVARAGTYSQADGFAGLTQVYTDATPEVQAFFEGERARLQAAHPARGATFVQTTRALAARLAEDVQVRSAPEARVLVDVQQQTEDGTAVNTVVRQAAVTFVRAGADWKVGRFAWQELAL